MPSPERPQRNYRWYDVDVYRINQIRRHLSRAAGRDVPEVEAVRHAIQVAASQLPAEPETGKKKSVRST